VESVCASLDPLLRLVEAHVMAAERLHADDATVPVLAKGKTDTGCWIYVRDDRPFGRAGPPAAMFYYSRDRRGEHAQAHLGGYARYPAGRRRVQPALSGGAPARTDPERPHVGSMRGARSSLWPTSKGMRVARPPVKRRSHSRPSRSRSCGGSMFEIERSINSTEGRLEVRQMLSRPCIA